MVAHEKRNSAQLFCAVPTRNELALSSLLFPAQPTQKLGYPRKSFLKVLQCARWHKRIRIRSFKEKKKPSKPCGFKGFPVGARGGT